MKIKSMKFEKLTEDMWEFVRMVRNHPENRGGFGNQNVSFSEHRDYMQKHHQNYRICFVRLRCECDKWMDCDCNHPSTPLTASGFIGIDSKDVRLAVLPEFQRRGVASFMLEEFLKEFPDCHAKVKIENTASLKLFEKFGFVKKYFVLELPENVGESE